VQTIEVECMLQSVVHAEQECEKQGVMRVEHNDGAYLCER
jgi:hypothetical protein